MRYNNNSDFDLKNILPDSFMDLDLDLDSTNKTENSPVNNLSLEPGEFKYLNEIKLAKNYTWQSDSFKF